MIEEEAERLEQQEAVQDEEKSKIRKYDVLRYLDDKCKQEVGEVLATLDSLEMGEERDRKAQEELTKIRREQRKMKREVSPLLIILI